MILFKNNNLYFLSVYLVMSQPEIYCVKAIQLEGPRDNLCACERACVCARNIYCLDLMLRNHEHLLVVLHIRHINVKTVKFDGV